ncbi:Fe2OG dioxygenase domain-containing protein [Favolaschia claudopus]|uniref:Fe2OG dioxygenase domain-containing protein n=1 Tax=Favolaschia claudopus TaxID=2862362 RepID=A0AAW0D640_9AGAR
MSTPVPEPANPTDDQTIAENLEILRNAIQKQVPYIGGVHPVKAGDLVVCYDVEGERPRRIDLGNASDNDLHDLADACQKATFDLNQADVLDETYRKAGKMDLDKFASRFDVFSSGLLAAIKQDIIQGQDMNAEDKIVVPELYKLNVYGPGSFFKAHKDTPRGDDMIGSLVVIFPTSHQGGGLTLEHDGAAWTFDSAAELAAATNKPAVAYVAFYSDVTHAVEPVISGHRVTLTYNLFLRDEFERPNAPDGVVRIIPSHSPDRVFEDTLRALLANSHFLPNGGFLAFGLSHQYPMPSEPEGLGWDRKYHHIIYPPSRLPPLLQLLKGSDARIRAASQRAGLQTHVKLLYDSGEKYYSPGNDVLVDDVLNMNEVYDEDGGLMRDIERYGVILERDEERMEDLRAKRGRRMDEEKAGKKKKKEVVKTAVHWVTKISELNRASSHYIAYGNEASVGHIYGNAGLFVEVPSFNTGVRTSEERD